MKLSLPSGSGSGGGGARRPAAFAFALVDALGAVWSGMHGAVAALTVEAVAVVLWLIILVI